MSERDRVLGILKRVANDKSWHVWLPYHGGGVQAGALAEWSTNLIESQQQRIQELEEKLACYSDQEDRVQYLAEQLAARDAALAAVPEKTTHKYTDPEPFVHPTHGRAALPHTGIGRRYEPRTEAPRCGRPVGLVICPACGEHLGRVRASDGHPARWWAEKTIQEHMAEKHD